MWLGFLWQRMRDSNPRKRSQSPVCYRYTNPLNAEHLYYIQKLQKVKHYFCLFSGAPEGNSAPAFAAKGLPEFFKKVSLVDIPFFTGMCYNTAA